jgi:hypothetical protein
MVGTPASSILRQEYLAPRVLVSKIFLATQEFVSAEVERAVIRRFLLLGGKEFTADEG